MATDTPLLDRLHAGAVELDIELTPSQLQLYRQYLSLLLEWNQRFNLTAIADPPAIIDKHFLDSLSLVLAVDLRDVKSLVDVGTGAGFPGMVLKIAFPHLEVLLLDSVAKRLRFLDRVAEALRLPGVATRHARAEEAGREPSLREHFDVATARAVARLNTLAEYCLPLVKRGGWFLAQKGPDVEDELLEAQSAIRRLGGGEAKVRQLVLPGTDIGRSLVLVPKVRSTPPEFPRQAGTPRKHPLSPET